MRAIILGSELPRAIAVIRSLGRAGIEVHLLDHRLRMPGAYSRYIHECHLQDHNGERPEGYSSDWYFSETRALEALDRLGAGGGLLIPTNDDYLRFTAKHHEHLSKSFVISHPPWSVMGQLMDKFKSFNAVLESGLNIPEFFTPRSEEEMRRISEGLNFEARAYILRTNLWCSGPADPKSGAFTRPGGQDAETLQERFMDIVSRTGSYPIIQEVVGGAVDSCIGVSMLVDRNHKPMITYCVKRLNLYTYYSKGGSYRHPYELGANVYAESTHDDEAVEAARTLVKHTQFYGPITVEFRRDTQDSSLKFIKADPRLINSIGLSTALGMDMPLAVFRYFAEGISSEQKDYRDGVIWVWLDRYVRTLINNRADSPVRQHLMSALKRIPRFKAFGYLSLRDRKPMYRVWQKEWRTSFGKHK